MQFKHVFICLDICCSYASNMSRLHMYITDVQSYSTALIILRKCYELFDRMFAAISCAEKCAGTTVSAHTPYLPPPKITAAQLAIVSYSTSHTAIQDHPIPAQSPRRTRFFVSLYNCANQYSRIT